MKDDAWHALIVAISNAPDLQGYSVRSLYKAFQTSSEQVKTTMSMLRLYNIWVCLLFFIVVMNLFSGKFSTSNSMVHRRIWRDAG